MRDNLATMVDFRDLCVTQEQYLSESSVGPPPAFRPPRSVEPYKRDTSRDWFDAAACKGMDPSFFVTERGEPTAQALVTCQGCEVRIDCLRWALEHDEVGLWGGTSGRERRRMKRGVA